MGKPHLPVSAHVSWPESTHHAPSSRVTGFTQILALRLAIMANTSILVKQFQSFQLDLPPSCIEFCPVHPSFLLVGTYNLVKDDSEVLAQDDEADPKQYEKPKKSQNRNGSVIAFKLHAGTL